MNIMVFSTLPTRYNTDVAVFLRGGHVWHSQNKNSGSAGDKLD